MAHSSGMMERTRILIADDHPLMRGALRQAVAQTLASAEILEAGTLDATVDQLRRQSSVEPIDLLLLDLHMPAMRGLLGLLLLRTEFPALPVIVVSAAEDADTIGRAQDYGASGYVPKSTPIDSISAAIRAVLAGGEWFPRRDTPRPTDDAELAQRLSALTPQQCRVLMMLSDGKLNKQIAWDMGVTEATVKAHVTVILRKLGVVSRTQAVIAARRFDVAPPAA